MSQPEPFPHVHPHLPGQPPQHVRPVPPVHPVHQAHPALPHPGAYRRGDAGRAGLAAAGVGGLLTLLAFLVMPTFSLPLFGAVTMPDLIGFVTLFGADSWNLLWLVPVAAAAVAGVGLTCGLRATGSIGSRQAGAGTIQIVALVVGTGYLLLPFVLADDELLSAGASARVMASLLDTGYYVGALGLLVALGGATVAWLDLRRA